MYRGTSELNTEDPTLLASCGTDLRDWTVGSRVIVPRRCNPRVWGLLSLFKRTSCRVTETSVQVDLDRNLYPLVVLIYLIFYGSKDCVKQVNKYNETLGDKEHINPNSLTSIVKFSGFAEVVLKHFEKSHKQVLGTGGIQLPKFQSVRGKL